MADSTHADDVPDGSEPGTRTRVEQLVHEAIPAVVVLLQDCLQTFAQLPVVFRVLLPRLRDLVAQRVLHLGRLGARGDLSLDVSVELGVRDHERRNPGVDAQ